MIVAEVSVEDGGHLVATGSAPANALVRLYLNGAYLADVTTGSDGRWSLTVEHGMRGGAYVIRADEIDRAKGSVIARAEVPFDYPELVADQSAAAKPPPPASAVSPTPVAASPKPPAAASEQPHTKLAATPTPARPEAIPPSPAGPSRPEPAPPSPAAAPGPTEGAPASLAAAPSKPELAAAPPAAASTVASAEAIPSSPPSAPASQAGAPPQASAEIPTPSGAANAVVRYVDTTKVVRGDSLWRISSHFYGSGLGYKQIYAANASQIRDPWLIYPGQIFVLPRQTPF